MTDHANSIIDFVQEQLKADPKDSKKFLAMQFGIFSVLIVAATAGLIFFLGPVTVAGSVAMVAQIAITAIGGLVATYIGGQSAVEFRANSVLNTSAQTYAPAALSPSDSEPLPVVVTNPASDPVPVETAPGGTGSPPPNFAPGGTGSPPPNFAPGGTGSPVSTKPFSADATRE